MVQRVLQLLYREVRGLHEAAYLLAMFTLGSQVLALLRDRLFAHEFGAGEALDIYYAAFRIPDLVFVGVASLVSVYVLIPFLAERLEESPEEVRAFLSRLFTFFIAVVLSLSFVLFIFAPAILPLLFPGFPQSAYSELVVLVRILLLQPILLGISNLFAGVTQVYRKFLLYAISPILYNTGIIVGIVFLYPLLGSAGLAWGVVLGALLHMGVQLPFISRQRLLPKITTNIDWREIREVLRLSIPRTLTLSVGQILLLAFVAIATLMTAGSIAVFTFAFNLQSVPLAIIGVSYSVAAFPTLARLITGGERKVFIEHIRTAARHILFWSVPAMVFFIVLRAQIVRVILGSGEFDWADTRLTAAALALFVLSLSAHGLMLLIVRAYYASGDTLKPFLINAVSSLAGISSAALLLVLFKESPEFAANVEALLRVSGIPGTEVLMLPLGYTIGMFVNAVFLVVFFARDFAPLTGSLFGVMLRSGGASLFGGAVAYTLLNIMDDVVDINTFFGIFAQGAVAGLFGLVALIAALYFLRSRELQEMYQALHNRVRGRPLPVPAEVVE